MINQVIYPKKWIKYIRKIDTFIMCDLKDFQIMNKDCQHMEFAYTLQRGMNIDIILRFNYTIKKCIGRITLNGNLLWKQCFKTP